MLNRICERCSTAFQVKIHEVKRGRGRFCSHSCASWSVPRRDLKGPANPNWLGVTGTEKSRRFKAKYPEKAFAHALMREAIRKGTLVRQPCEKCGNTTVDGHHDDYSKPLDVRWLCRKHHTAHHALTPKGLVVVSLGGAEMPVCIAARKLKCSPGRLSEKVRKDGSAVHSSGAVITLVSYTPLQPLVQSDKPQPKGGA